jgi:hypothetical protein
MQHVGADHEVERLREPERGQLVEAGLSQIALPAEARHGVLARVDTEVTHARTKRAETRLPRPFTAADV